MKLLFSNHKFENCPLEKTMEKALLLCLKNENVETEGVEISIAFVEKEEIKELNKVYRNTDRATDVLSFPQYESIEAIKQANGVVALGDIVVATEIAAIQAEEYGHSFSRELIYLCVHSLLHLLGYHHTDEANKKVMREKEEAVMEALNLLRADD